MPSNYKHKLWRLSDFKALVSYPESLGHKCLSLGPSSPGSVEVSDDVDGQENSENQRDQTKSHGHSITAGISIRIYKQTCATASQLWLLPFMFGWRIGRALGPWPDWVGNFLMCWGTSWSLLSTHTTLSWGSSLHSQLWVGVLNEMLQPPAAMSSGHTLPPWWWRWPLTLPTPVLPSQYLLPYSRYLSAPCFWYTHLPLYIPIALYLPRVYLRS